MGTSFSSQGSTAGTPQKGLLGNPKPGFSQISGALGSGTPRQPITPFVPGTQKPLPNPFNRTITAEDSLGTPTASGNTKLQGSNYFQGLVNSPNPSERLAGQTWLSHQTTPGLLPKHPVSSITTSPDGTTKHTFDTKNGNSAGNSSSSSTSGNTGTNPGLLSTGDSAVGTNPGLLPGSPKVGTPTQNAQNVLDQSSLNNNPEYQALATQNNALVKAGGIASQTPYSGQNQTIGQSLADISRPQSTGNLAGELGNLNNQISQGLSGNAAEAGRLISGAQLATGGAENVLGASTYSPTSYGQTNTSGLTGVQDAGKYGSGPAAAANVQSIKDLTTQYNQGLTTLKAADGIQNQITSTLQNNPELNTNPISLLTNLNEYVSGQTGTAAQQLLAQQINSYVTTLGIDPASLVSLQTQQQGTLAQLLDSLRKTAQTKNDALNPANLAIQGASSTSNSSGSSTGDSSTSGFGWNG